MSEPCNAPKDAAPGCGIATPHQHSSFDDPIDCPLTDKRPTPSGEMIVEEVVSVSWYEHDCDWITKYCDEEHRRSAFVPVSVLDQYVLSQKGTP